MKLQCPKCESINIAQYRRPTGPIWCHDCSYSVPEKEKYNPFIKIEKTVWKRYRKIAEQEMRPYILGEDLTGVSVSERDVPGEGGMIARGADDGALWYVSKEFFNENYVLIENKI